MSKLSKEEIELITKCLKDNKPLPDTLIDMLFLLRQRINESLFDDTRKTKGEVSARNIGYVCEG